MHTDTDLPTTPGTVIAGKYRVEGVIGEGGMGAIIKARHLTLNRDVAIKLMRSEITGVHKASERFLREARATANIESEYVARVSDIDVLPSGTPFIVMEFLDGVDLASHLSGVRQRKVTEAVDWMMQTLCGLAMAHALGIVHRDLKPTNLFVLKRADGTLRVKVLDFGVSKVLDDSDFSREGHNDGLTTASNFVVGTPRYMAPEQITAPKEVDERADLWAVGLILYEILVGAHPFDGKTPGAIMGNVLSAPVLPIDSFRADVPRELTQIVERCLQRDRNLRFESATELLRALSPFGSPQLAATLLAALPPDKPRRQPTPVHQESPPLKAGGFAGVQPVVRKALGEAPGNTQARGAAQNPEAATVHTPSVSATGSLAISVSLEQPVKSTLLSADSDSGQRQLSARDPGTVLEWDSERGRERPKRTALIVTATALATLAASAGLFMVLREPATTEAASSEINPVIVHQTAARAPSPAASPAAQLPAAQSPAPAQTAAPTAVASAGGVPHVAPIPVSAAAKAAPAPAAPFSTLTTTPGPTHPAAVSTKKAAKNATGSREQTAKNKNSILGTRN